MASEPMHVGIIGAGLGGLVAAIAIRRAGPRVTVLEQAAELKEIGAGIQIPPNSSNILKRYGLLEKLEAVAVRPNALVFRSYRDGQVLHALELDPAAEKKYGSPYLLLHRAEFHTILLEEAKRLGVQVTLGCTVTAIDFDHRRVHIKGASPFVADAFIGADGLKSSCRSALLQQESLPKPTGDLAYRIVVNAKDIQKHEALRELVDKPEMNYWLGPSAHVVSYLLQGGRLLNVVLLCPDNLPEMILTEKANLLEMRSFFEQWEPRLKLLLDLVQDTTKWKLMDSDELREWRDASGRFALLGDACHATLPYLAQGAAQAVEDGAVLGELFARIERKAQIPVALSCYEELRKKRTTRVVQESAALRDTFHLENGERQRERDRQLREDEPFEGFPHRWADPCFQKWLFGYDAFGEVEKVWPGRKSLSGNSSQIDITNDAYGKAICERC